MADNLTRMPEFRRLPSGLVVNLKLVTRIVVADGLAEPTLTVHFSGGGTGVLTAEDAVALRKRTGTYSPISSNARAVIFWIAILVAVILVYLAARQSR